MNFRQFLLISTFLFTITACVGKELQMNNRANPYNLEFYGKENSTLHETDIPIHFNPNPKEIYEITIKISEDSPMPLLPMEPVWVQYAVANCYYQKNRFSVYILSPNTKVKVPITQVDKNTYKMTFIADAILDEDYGLTLRGKPQGMCHWGLSSSLTVGFSPTGQDQYSTVSVHAILRLQELESLSLPKTKIFYFDKQQVTTKPVKVEADGTSYGGFNFVGRSREDLKKNPKFAHLKDSDLFTMTVSIKKLAMEGK